jgi:peptidoglycan/xylan/chitin deacetylase (PgdA/CDA1 family)
MQLHMGRFAQAWRSVRVTLGAMALAVLASCAHAPPSAPPTSAAGSATQGKVLGRNAQLVIYQRAPGETVRQVAARFLGNPDRDWEIEDFNHLPTNSDAPDAPPTLVIPLTQRNPLGVYSDRYQTVPILCYHRFGRTSNGKMTVSATAFAAQLDWLVRNRYHVLKLADLRDWLDGKRALPLHSAVITADDGYASFYHQAFPLLKQYGLPATLFVYTDFIGAGDAVDWAELQEMSRSGLVDVAAHSRTHRNLIERPPNESDEAYQQMLLNEIRAPQTLLSQKLGIPIEHFAYPYGDANEAVLTLMARQRYRLGATVNPGGNAFFSEPLMLRRTMIYGDMSLEDFKARVQISRMTGGS